MEAIQGAYPFHRLELKGSLYFGEAQFFRMTPILAHCLVTLVIMITN
jgi:hypothetical protein